MVPKLKASVSEIENDSSQPEQENLKSNLPHPVAN